MNQLHSTKTGPDYAYNDLIGERWLGSRKGSRTARKKCPPIHRI